MKFNHLDLPVHDVPGAAAFFAGSFGMRKVVERPGFALLHDDAGFALVLSELGPDECPKAGQSRPSPEGNQQSGEATFSGEPQAYPRGFHVGFNLPLAADVEALHAALSRAGVPMARGLGLLGGALTFQCQGPGGLVVEVGHRAG